MSLPIMFQHSVLARKLESTTEPRAVIDLMLDTLTSPDFKEMRNPEIICIILFFLDRANIPLEEIAMSADTEVNYLRNWLAGVRHMTSANASHVEIALLDALTSRQPASRSAI